MLTIYLVLGVILTCMLVFALSRLWVMKIARKSIQGSDLHMLKWCIQENTRAWAGFHITFMEEAPFTELKEETLNNIEKDLQSSKSDYRRGLDLQTKQYIFHHDYHLENIILETDDDSDFFQLSDPSNRELVYKFHNKRRLIGALFDHTVWDGIRMFNETLSPAIKSKPFESKWLLGDKYFPIVSEFLMFYTMTVMSFRWLTHRGLKTLENSQDQMLLRHRLKKTDVTTLKQTAHCKFTAALLALWAQQLYGSLPAERKKLRFGLVIGMNNPRFRNNYSVMIIDISRHEDAKKQAQEVQKQMQRRAIEVLPLYHHLSLLEMQSTLKSNMIDCLFSPGIFDIGEGPSKYVKDLFLYIVPTSMPLYSFACSLGDGITISTTWNCAEVSLDSLSSNAEALYEQGESERLIPIFDRELDHQQQHRQELSISSKDNIQTKLEAQVPLDTSRVLSHQSTLEDQL